MFGFTFELRVDYWERFASSRFALVSSLIAMSRRLYLGSTYTSLLQLLLSSSSSLAELPPDTRSEDVSKFFDGYGKIIDCRVMTG
jgi:arginine/serine-rich splicing factor 4/5/6